jgi:hypothetical protein
MKEWPDSFWAAMFILLACLLALASLFSHSPGATAVITMASSIITGAFGYIQGKKSASDSLQVPPNAGASTTVSVVPTQPVEPAQTKAGA